MSGDSIRGKVVLVNPNGLHLSPISALVKNAMNFEAEIKICFNGNTASAKSAMDLMLLGATCGSELTVEAVGDDAAESVESVIQLLSQP